MLGFLVGAARRKVAEDGAKGRAEVRARIRAAFADLLASSIELGRRDGRPAVCARARTARNIS